MKKSKNYYNNFVKEGRNVGFTDDQIDFIWDWIFAAVEVPEVFTHPDNYANVKLPKGKKSNN